MQGCSPSPPHTPRRAAEDTLAPPLWRDFANAMAERLLSLDRNSDALRLAEEHKAALGQHALDAGL